MREFFNKAVRWLKNEAICLVNYRAIREDFYDLVEKDGWEKAGKETVSIPAPAPSGGADVAVDLYVHPKHIGEHILFCSNNWTNPILDPLWRDAKKSFLRERSPA